MRRPFTIAICEANGVSVEKLRWKLHTGEWQRIQRGVFLAGSEPPTDIERALAIVVITGGTASHSLAGMLYDLDGVELRWPFVTVAKRPRCSKPSVVARSVDAVRVHGYKCTTGLQTAVDLAAVVDDLEWEQVLENCLRNRLLALTELQERLPILSKSRTPGVGRIRRVLALRPDEAPPTESLLETLMVQLIRTEPSLPIPTRQLEIRNKYGDFVGRPDLCWPELGVFIVLDGLQHKGQPLYDSRRETAIVAATGWLPARFIWREVRYLQRATLRRLVDIAEMAMQRSF